MKLGFCTMGYLDYTTVEEAVKRIARTGYDVIDFWAYSPHLGPDLYSTRQQRAAVKKLVADGIWNLPRTGLAVESPVYDRDS